MYARLYDLEKDIGVIAEDDDLRYATRNTQRINAALNSQSSVGAFKFVDGHIGPITGDIVCDAKEFFFAGTIKTSRRIGSTIRGSGRSYSLGSLGYGGFGIGGNVTRFTRIDGDTVGDGSNNAILLIRCAGGIVENIEFKGRKYGFDPDGGGPEDPHTSPRTPSGIEIEAHSGTPTTSKTLIRNCNICFCASGLKMIGGYYQDNGHFVTGEDAGDIGVLDCCTFTQCDSCFHAENSQSCGWYVPVLHVTRFGYHETVVFDCPRGEVPVCNCLILEHGAVTIAKVRDWAHQTSRIVVENIRWDRGTQASEDSEGNPYYLTLLKYTGATDPTTLGYAKWDARFTGNIANSDPDNPNQFHYERLMEIPAGMDRSKLLVDITRMPLNNFESAGVPWVKPK